MNSISPRGCCCLRCFHQHLHDCGSLQGSQRSLLAHTHTHTHTHAHGIMLSIWWAHVIACREPGAHTECWLGSLGASFREKGGTGERFHCAFRAMRKKDRKKRGGQREREKEMDLPMLFIKVKRCLYHLGITEHVCLNTQQHRGTCDCLFLSDSPSPSHLLEATAHKPADPSPLGAFAQTFVPTLP